MLEVLGLILSFVGLITIIPQVLNFLRSYLPEHRLKQLDVTLKETIDMLDAATQDGLLNDPTFVSSTRGDLYCLRDVTENLRAIVLSAPGIYQQCVAFTNGLSIRIRKTHEDVKDIRARIAAVSDEARQQLLPKMRSYRDPCNEASETIVHSNLGVVPNGWSLNTLTR
ncbi:hypothetical protein BXZ70DRAFT_740850 [Cristinia sonorae]|uniref:Uncharacterized protein n=1 Tax=Cristinia sonorae TaxID=1940300 RepID=A0A8K0XSY6_9AGAR|nr:hypothetical protein BXZ70DRAFT_740850 [Cristinia sonorae]